MDSIGGNDGMLCEVCGQRYHTIYSVDDELWVKVTGAVEQENAPGYFSGLWCPNCFSQEARAKGITVRWGCAEEWSNLPGKERVDKMSEPVKLGRYKMEGQPDVVVTDNCDLGNGTYGPWVYYRL